MRPWVLKLWDLRPWVLRPWDFRPWDLTLQTLRPGTVDHETLSYEAQRPGAKGLDELVKTLSPYPRPCFKPLQGPIIDDSWVERFRGRLPERRKPSREKSRKELENIIKKAFEIGNRCSKLYKIIFQLWILLVCSVQAGREQLFMKWWHTKGM